MKSWKNTIKSTQIALAAAVFSFILIACPPINESEFENVMYVTGELTNEKWNTILKEIYDIGIPVILDLGGCTMPESGDVLKEVHDDGTDYVADSGKSGRWVQFDPSQGNSEGKELITSLVLPDAARMIRNASHNIEINSMDDATENELNNNAFRHFSRLRYVTGANIFVVGTFAFANVKTLEAIDFPRLAYIRSYAFYGCSSLKQIELINAIDIMPGAFEKCTSLERVVAPKLGLISQRVFMDCTSLKRVSFPLVTKIDQRAFMNCTELTEVSFSIAMIIADEAFRNCRNLKYAEFLANPVKKASGHPLEYDIGDITWSDCTMAFYPGAFQGTSLEVLFIPNAWNVYFAGNSLADIGTTLDLYLFDSDDPEKCYGHPQTDTFLGKTPSLNQVTIYAPVGSQIEKQNADAIELGIASYIRSAYAVDTDERDEDDNILTLFDVTVLRGPGYPYPAPFPFTSY